MATSPFPRSTWLFAGVACVLLAIGELWFSEPEVAPVGFAAQAADAEGDVDFAAKEGTAARGPGGAKLSEGGGSAPTRQAGPEQVRRFVVGTLFAGNGAPAVESEFLWSVSRGEGRVEEGRSTTDASGTFSFEFVRGDAPVVAMQFRLPEPGGGISAGARVVVPPADESGRADLGEVRLTAYVLLASGRVENDLGQPIAGAVVTAVDPKLRFDKRGFRTIPGGIVFDGGQVELSVENAQVEVLRSGIEIRPYISTQGSERTIRQLDLSSGELRVIEGGLEQMMPPDGVVARTRSVEDGSFRLFGPYSRATLQLTATAEGHHKAERELASPGEVVTLRLRRVCKVRAEVFVATGLPERVVRFRLDGGDWSVAPKSVEYGVGPAGVQRYALVFEDVPVGSARFLASLRHLEQSAVAIDGLVIDPDRPIGLEQIQPLDLRNALYRYSVRAVKPNRQALNDLASPLLLHIPTGGKERVVALNWVEGEAEFYSPRAEVEATLLLPGYRNERITLRAGEGDLVYTPIHPVRVVLPGLREAAGDTDRVRVSMIRRGSTGLPQNIQGVDVRTGKSRSYSRWHLGRSGGAWLGETDEVRVPLVLDGTYDVIIRLQRKGVPGEESITAGRVEVSLQNLAAEQHVVTIDAAQIRSAVERQRATAQRPR